jgi:Helix-turn-helix domain
MVMKRAYYRIGFTAGQSAELWERWKRGEGLKAIGRVLGKPSSCIFSHLSVSGGIRPPSRRRSRLALTLAEREEISRGLVAGLSVRSMAMALGRSPSQSAVYDQFCSLMGQGAATRILSGCLMPLGACVLYVLDGT